MDRRESVIVFDLETKKAFHEVGGPGNHHLLGVSVAGVYDYLTDELFALEERELRKLEQLIKDRELVVGFNIKDFDYKVLKPYLKTTQLNNIQTLDLLEEIEKAAGFRVGLNNLAKNTLGVEKSGHGLEALEWFREGKIENVKKYCLDDVILTRDLYEYGKNHGLVRFHSRVEGLKTIPAGWAPGNQETSSIKAVLAKALDKKLLVEIDYVSSRAHEGEEARKKREIEIHAIHGSTVEAYCHLRQDMRRFKIWRIMDANIKEGKVHTRPTLF